MEVEEGKSSRSHGIIFKRIGPELYALDEPGGFKDTIPVQGLAVSNKYGLTFFVHLDGFSMAYTKDLVQASQKLVDTPKAKCFLKEKCIASVTLPNIRFLALSSDDLTLAACLENNIHFYNVLALLQKGKSPSQLATKSVMSLSVADGVKLFTWNPTENDAYVFLSNDGTLTSGNLMHEATVIAEHVDAVDWSPDGEYLAYISSVKNLHMVKLDSTASMNSSTASINSELPPELFGETSEDGEAEGRVDMLKWARLDSLLISSVHRNTDGEEDDCWIFLLISSEGHVAKDVSRAKILTYELFAELSESIIPSGTGPYTLASFLQTWDFTIVTSRRCIDDHIGMLGWLIEDNKLEPYKFEYAIDNYTPRIELQENGDDNSVVGLAIDLTTSYIQLPVPGSEAGEKLPPGPVLLCLTLEGKLTLFSVARTDPKWIGVQVVAPPLNIPEVGGLCCPKMMNNKPVKEDRLEAAASARDSELRNEDNKHSLGDFSPSSFKVSGERQLGSLHESKEASNLLRIDRTSQAVPLGRPKEPISPFRAASTVVKQPLGSVLQVQPKPVKFEAPKPLQEHSSAIELHPLNFGISKQEQACASPVSEMESEFLKELEKVKQMANQIEDLLLCIDGRIPLQKAKQKIFTRASFEDIEHGIQKISSDCRLFQAELKNQRENFADLMDESKQVNDWRLYMQSLFEQASDRRYQELWNKQKLHPRMDALRKQILKVDQSVKQQIAELEEHLHNLELSQWGRKCNQSTYQTSTLPNSENFQRMQILYGTVNTQMAVAQKLSERLATQIETLKQSYPRKEEFHANIETSISKLENMGLDEQSSKRSSFHFIKTRPTLTPRESAEFSPSKTGMSYYSMQTPKKPDFNAAINACLQDSTRRRRDSLDKLWSDVGAAKTTVKRATPVRGSRSLPMQPIRGGFENENTNVKSLGGFQAPEPIPSSAGQLFGNVNLFSSKHREGSQVGGTGTPLGKSGNSHFGVDHSKETESSNLQNWSTWSLNMKQSDAVRPVLASPTSRDPYSTSSTAFSGQGNQLFNTATLQASANKNDTPKTGFFSQTSSATSSTTAPQLQNGSTTQLGLAKLGKTGDGNFTLSSSWPTFQSSGGPLQGKPPARQLESLATQQGSVRLGKTATSSSTQFAFQLKTSGNMQVKAPTVQMEALHKLEGEDIDKIGMLQERESRNQTLETQAGGSKSTSFFSKVSPEAGSSITSLDSRDTNKPDVYSSNSNVSDLMKSQVAVSESVHTYHPISTVIPPTEPLQIEGTLQIENPKTIPSSTTAEKTAPVLPLSGNANSTASLSFSTKSALDFDISTQMPSISTTVSDKMPTVFSSPVKPEQASAVTDTPGGQLLNASASFTSDLGSESKVFNSSPFPQSSTTDVSSKIEVSSIKRETQPTTLTGPPFVSSFSVSPATEAVAPVLQQNPLATVSAAPSSFTAQGPPTMSDEEDMEEEASSTLDFGTGFTGFGLGATTRAAESQHSSPFGVSPFGSQTGSPTMLSVPSGQVFKPASFSLPTIQSSPQSSGNTFMSNVTSGSPGAFGPISSGFGSPAQLTGAAFGQPAQPGLAQQVLGSSLGAFGQTRQIGAPFGASSFAGFGVGSGGGSAGAATGSGFASVTTGGGGFANAATGGGFASIANTGGFASAATVGGFASVASGGGFGGFAAASGGGFQSFGGTSGAFGSFGIQSSGTATNSSIFTQMRK